MFETQCRTNGGGWGSFQIPMPAPMKIMNPVQTYFKDRVTYGAIGQHIGAETQGTLERTH